VALRGRPRIEVPPLHCSIRVRPISAVGRFCCKSQRAGAGGLSRSVFWGRRTLGADCPCDQTVARAISGGGLATILARRLRFCAIAGSVNSNCAPLGPRRRNRSRRIGSPPRRWPPERIRLPVGRFCPPGTGCSVAAWSRPASGCMSFWPGAPGSCPDALDRAGLSASLREISRSSAMSRHRFGAQRHARARDSSA
jgi:hypothetical protein